MTTYDTAQSWLSSQIAGVFQSFEGVPKGFFVSAVVAVCAQFLSDHYGAPAMLMALLIAIAAVGMKTPLSTISTIGGQAIVLIVSETVFIAGFMVIGIHYLR